MGRPALFATTRQFLDDLGLSSLNQLPPLEDSGVQESSLDTLNLDVLSQSLQASLVDDEPTAPTVSDPMAAAVADGASDHPSHADPEPGA